MEALIAHLQENAVLYAAGGICLLPVIYLTRKFSVPAILYLVEFSIYSGLLHVATNVLVRVTRWFKESSSMRALREDGKPIDTPEWSTPLIEFWKTEEYDPNWVWKMEVAFLVVILIIMWRYRPMKIQRKGGRKTQEYASGGKGKPGGYKPGGYKPGAYQGTSGKGGKGGGFKSPRGTRGR